METFQSRSGLCRFLDCQQVIFDIDHRPRGESPTWILSEDGEWLGQIIADRSRRHLTIDWNGSGNEYIHISQTQVLFDCSGRKKVIFELPLAWTDIDIESYKGDFTGNGVPDILFHTVPADEIYIFRNVYGRKLAGIALGTAKNFTLY